MSSLLSSVIYSSYSHQQVEEFPLFHIFAKTYLVRLVSFCPLMRVKQYCIIYYLSIVASPNSISGP